MGNGKQEMNPIHKTLYIPLYGKAFISKNGIILQDKKAEEIWEKEGFPLKKKSKSKWLAYYMGMRSAVFDGWLKEKLQAFPNSMILHLGCGLDSRIERIGTHSQPFYDVDFPEVIKERKKHFQETSTYQMLSADIKNCDFLQEVDHPEISHAIVLLEGVSMYLENERLQAIFSYLSNRFSHLSVLVDCYTPFAAKMSKIKNPVREVGVLKVYGVKNPSILEQNTGLTFVTERSLTPPALIDQLHGIERSYFKKLYAGKISKSLYKLYEFEK